jgi:hypothetical protein
MKKERAFIHMTFSVDLDPVPGFGHQVEDWVSYVRSALADRNSHYNPKVEITETGTIPYVFHDGKWILASELDTKTLMGIVQRLGTPQEEERSWEKSPGQLAYEADCAAQPNYHDGQPRKTWAELRGAAKCSWERDPTPRFWPEPRDSEWHDQENCNPHYEPH